MRIMKFALAAVMVLSISAGIARSDTIVVSFVSSDALGNFNYSVGLSPFGKIKTGDGFTIFDFAGFVSGSLAGWPAAIVESGSSIGATVAALGAATSPGGDDPLIGNVTFKYSGTTIDGNGATFIDLGIATVKSLYKSTTTDVAVSRDSGTDLPFAFGPLTVPLALQHADPMPLPSGIWSGLGLLGALAGFRLRKRS